MSILITLKFYLLLINWNSDPERIQDGQLVKSDFIYSSDSNLDWMKERDLEEWIQENKEMIGKI